MPHSNVIFGYLALAFVMFITLRGDLPTYAGFLFAVPKPPQKTADAGDTSGGGLNAQAMSLLQSGSKSANDAIANAAQYSTHGANTGGAGALFAALI